MSRGNGSSGLPVLDMAWSSDPGALCEYCKDLREPFRGTRYYQRAGDEQVRMRCQMCRLIEACVTAGRPRFISDKAWSSVGRMVSLDDRNGLVVYTTTTVMGKSSPAFSYRLHTVSGDLGFRSRLFEQNAIAGYAGDCRSLDLLRNSLVECLDGHPECRERGDGGGFVPTRLLEIESDGLSVRLIETEGSSMPMRYAALSHCWGASPALRTTRSNFDSHLRSMPTRSLPANFRDAVRLCQAMLTRHLWIDSLCIVQDDLDEWARESQAMGAVYSNAIFTIAAAASETSAQGFLGRKVRQQSRASLLELRLHSERGGDCVMHLRLGDHDPFNVRDPLDTRAWAFQEGILSRRIMRLTQYQTKWQCNRHEVCESGLRQPRPRSLNLDRLAEQGPEHIWRENIRLLIEYSRRHVTRSTDLLPSIAGYMSRFARITGWTYLAGLWDYKIHLDLAWSRLRSGDGFALAVSKECPPSWSWASLDAPSHFSWGSPEDEIITTDPNPWGSETCKSQFSIIGMECKAATANRFGAVAEGAHIRILARLVDVIVICNREEDGKKHRFRYAIVPGSDETPPVGVRFVADCPLKMTVVVTEDDQVLPNVKRVSSEQKDYVQTVGTLGPAKCMLLYDNHNPRSVFAAQALVLGRAHVSSNGHRRLGLVTWLGKGEGEEESDFFRRWQRLFDEAQPQVIDLY